MTPRKEVWKFHVQVSDTAYVEMPEGGKIISARSTSNPSIIAVWAIVDPTAPVVPQPIYIRGTGHPLREAADATFIDTVVTKPLVWHVFQEQK